MNLCSKQAQALAPALMEVVLVALVEVVRTLHGDANSGEDFKVGDDNNNRD